jgi:hypothetical protein
MKDAVAVVTSQSKGYLRWAWATVGVLSLLDCLLWASLYWQLEWVPDEVVLFVNPVPTRYFGHNVFFAIAGKAAATIVLLLLIPVVVSSGVAAVKEYRSALVWKPSKCSGFLLTSTAWLLLAALWLTSFVDLMRGIQH